MGSRVRQMDIWKKRKGGVYDVPPENLHVVKCPNRRRNCDGCFVFGIKIPSSVS